MRHYTDFMRKHPRISLGVTALGLITMVIGAAGIPSDLEAWGNAFDAVGSDLGRWILVGVGLAVVLGSLAPRIRFQDPSPRPQPVRRKVRLPPPPRPSSSSSHGRRYGSGAIRQAMVDAARQKAIQDIEHELVTMIEEWRLIRGDAFGETDYGVYSLWTGKTSDFIGKVLGEVERQRFEGTAGESAPTLRQSAALRIQELERLRDNPDKWQVQLEGQELTDAIQARQQLTPQDRIVLAGSPLADQYEISTVDDQAKPDIVTSLGTERKHGYRLLSALENPAERFGYEEIPGPEDVERWEAQVKNLLRDDPERLRLFLYIPPIARNKSGGNILAGLLDAMAGGSEIRRLQQRLRQLDVVLQSYGRN
jgi:hypothetical protein